MWERKGGRVHAFLLEDDEGSLTMIDALYATDGATIFAKLEQIGKTPADIANIVLTHAHRSHIGGIKALKEAGGATVWADAMEADIVAGIRNATRVSVFPRRPFRVLHLQWGLALGFGRDHPPVPVDETITDGARIGPVQAIHTPGHTPGSYSFWWPERRALFAGDAMVTWPRVEAGWKGLTLDNAQNRRSLGGLAEVGDVEMVGVGHGAPLEADCAAMIAATVAGHRLPGLPLLPPITT
jgi:glyoxylase-like metal-dependent hydrolase (beta-lactamase superfamily II)